MTFLRYDIEEKMTRYAKEHKRDLKLFFILLTVSVVIYGQKLFFYSLPSDDYMRFWGDDNTQMLITNSARWAQALLNEYLFVGKLQILPYLHGFIGIFCFTLMGYLSARFLGREKGLEIAITSLLIAATPMFAHNLYFSTNITTWLSLLIGLIGFLKLYRPGIASKSIGVLFLLFSIGNYQSIVQIVVLLVIFHFLLELLQNRGQTIRTLFVQSVLVVALTLVAYVASGWINDYFLHHYHLHEIHRLKQAENGMHLDVLLYHLKTAYTTSVPFNFFSKPLHMLYGLLALLALGGTLFFIMRRKVSARDKLLMAVLLLLAFAAIPPVVNLPLLLGVDIPLRAHFPLGWALGGLFVLIMATTKGMVKSIAIAVAILIIVVNSYYITRFFDGCARQTDADIRRANMIVQRIRMDKHYDKEPMGFRIEGQKKFNVKGWQMQWQQPFNSYWAKYKIFQYFTDFQFRGMTPQELNGMVDHIIKKGERVSAYPGKNSIVVYHNTAILFLNADRMNIQIEKSKNVQKIPLNRAPDVNASFDLYVEKGILFYHKSECRRSDILKKFFLRVYPADPNNTLINGRRGVPFQTLDFDFSLYGVVQNGSCTAAVVLPKQYKISKIRTGQFGQKDIAWEITYILHH